MEKLGLHTCEAHYALRPGLPIEKELPNLGLHAADGVKKGLSLVTNKRKRRSTLGSDMLNTRIPTPLALCFNSMRQPPATLRISRLTETTHSAIPGVEHLSNNHQHARNFLEPVPKVARFSAGLRPRYSGVPLC